MKNHLLSFACAIFLLFGSLCLSAQVSINMDGSQPDNSAILDVKSTSRGFLPPRMTQGQIGEISAPADGLMAFCATDSKVYVFVAADNKWKEVLYGQGFINPTSCGQPITDNRDNKTYNTVLIGNQCWMKENMNLGTMIQVSTAQTNHNDFEKYCMSNLEANCDVYGGLYQWNNAMQWSQVPGSQGICPAGWHIPTEAEWSTLVTFLGGDAIAGGTMKEAGTEHWSSPNSGTNSSGFTALGGGFTHINTFNAFKGYGTFWSSTQYLSFSYTYTRELWFSGDYIHDHAVEWGDGYSIRCLRN
ncbi:MAG: FISUMP domain-containing protein [Bacteroidota bacterium]